MKKSGVILFLCIFSLFILASFISLASAFSFSGFYDKYLNFGNHVTGKAIGGVDCSDGGWKTEVGICSDLNNDPDGCTGSYSQEYGGSVCGYDYDSDYCNPIDYCSLPNNNIDSSNTIESGTSNNEQTTSELEYYPWCESSNDCYGWEYCDGVECVSTSCNPGESCGNGMICDVDGVCVPLDLSDSNIEDALNQIPSDITNIQAEAIANKISSNTEISFDDALAIINAKKNSQGDITLDDLRNSFGEDIVNAILDAIYENPELVSVCESITRTDFCKARADCSWDDKTGTCVSYNYKISNPDYVAGSYTPGVGFVPDAGFKFWINSQDEIVSGRGDAIPQNGATLFDSYDEAKNAFSIYGYVADNTQELDSSNMDLTSLADVLNWVGGYVTNEQYIDDYVNIIADATGEDPIKIKNFLDEEPLTSLVSSFGENNGAREYLDNKYGKDFVNNVLDELSKEYRNYIAEENSVPIVLYWIQDNTIQSGINPPKDVDVFDTEEKAQEALDIINKYAVPGEKVPTTSEENSIYSNFEAQIGKMSNDQIRALSKDIAENIINSQQDDNPPNKAVLATNIWIELSWVKEEGFDKANEMVNKANQLVSGNLGGLSLPELVNIYNDYMANPQIETSTTTSTQEQTTNKNNLPDCTDGGWKTETSTCSNFDKDIDGCTSSYASYYNTNEFHPCEYVAGDYCIMAEQKCMVFSGAENPISKIITPTTTVPETNFENPDACYNFEEANCPTSYCYWDNSNKLCQELILKYITPEKAPVENPDACYNFETKEKCPSDYCFWDETTKACWDLSLKENNQASSQTQEVSENKQVNEAELADCTEGGFRELTNSCSEYTSEDSSECLRHYSSEYSENYFLCNYNSDTGECYGGNNCKLITKETSLEDLKNFNARIFGTIKDGNYIRNLDNELIMENQGKTGSILKFHKKLDIGFSNDNFDYVDAWIDIDSDNTGAISVSAQQKFGQLRQFQVHFANGLPKQANLYETDKNWNALSNGQKIQFSTSVGSDSSQVDFVSSEEKTTSPTGCTCVNSCEFGFNKRIKLWVYNDDKTIDNAGILTREGNSWASSVFSGNVLHDSDTIVSRITMGSNNLISLRSGAGLYSAQNCEEDVNLCEGSAASNNGNLNFKVISDICKAIPENTCQYTNMMNSIQVNVNGNNEVLTKTEMVLNDHVKYSYGRDSISFFFNSETGTTPNRASGTFSVLGTTYDLEIAGHFGDGQTYQADAVDRNSQLVNIQFKLLEDPCPLVNYKKKIVVDWYPGLFGADLAQSLGLLNSLRNYNKIPGYSIEVNDRRGSVVTDEKYLMAKLNPGDVYVLGGWSSGGPASFEHLQQTIKALRNLYGSDDNIPVVIGDFRFDPTGSNPNEAGKDIITGISQKVMPYYMNVFSNEQKGFVLGIFGKAGYNNWGSNSKEIDLGGQVTHWGISNDAVVNKFKAYLVDLAGKGSYAQSNEDTIPIPPTTLQTTSASRNNPPGAQYSFNSNGNVLYLKRGSDGKIYYWNVNQWELITNQNLNIESDRSLTKLN